MLTVLTNIRSTKVFWQDSHHSQDGYHPITTFSTVQHTSLHTPLYGIFLKETLKVKWLLAKDKKTRTKIVHTCVRPYKTVQNQTRPLNYIKPNKTTQDHNTIKDHIRLSMTVQYHSRLYKTLRDPYGPNNSIPYKTITDQTKPYQNIQDKTIYDPR